MANIRKIVSRNFGKPENKKTSKIILAFEVSDEDSQVVMNRTVEFLRKLRRHREIGYCIENLGSGDQS